MSVHRPVQTVCSPQALPDRQHKGKQKVQKKCEADSDKFLLFCSFIVQITGETGLVTVQVVQSNRVREVSETGSDVREDWTSGDPNQGELRRWVELQRHSP